MCAWERSKKGHQEQENPDMQDMPQNASKECLYGKSVKDLKKLETNCKKSSCCVAFDKCMQNARKIARRGMQKKHAEKHAENMPKKTCNGTCRKSMPKSMQKTCKTSAKKHAKKARKKHAEKSMQKACKTGRKQAQKHAKRHAKKHAEKACKKQIFPAPEACMTLYIFTNITYHMKRP